MLKLFFFTARLDLATLLPEPFFSFSVQFSEWRMLLVVMIVMSNPITTLADNDWPKYSLKYENNSLQRAENYHIIIIISNKMIIHTQLYLSRDHWPMLDIIDNIDIVDIVDMTQVCSCNCLHSLLSPGVEWWSGGAAHCLVRVSPCAPIVAGGWWPAPCRVMLPHHWHHCCCVWVWEVEVELNRSKVRGGTPATNTNTNHARGAHLWGHLGHRQGKLANLTRKR